MDNDAAAFALRAIGEHELAGETNGDWEAAVDAADDQGDTFEAHVARLRAHGAAPDEARWLAGTETAMAASSRRSGAGHDGG